MPRTRWRRPFTQVLVDGILGLLGLATKPRGRPCVMCGARVKRGATACPRCGYHTWPTAGSAWPLPPPSP